MDRRSVNSYPLHALIRTANAVTLILETEKFPISKEVIVPFCSLSLKVKPSFKFVGEMEGYENNMITANKMHESLHTSPEEFLQLIHRRKR